MSMPNAGPRVWTAVVTTFLVAASACVGESRRARVDAIDPAALSFVASFYEWFAAPRAAGGGDRMFVRVLEERAASLDTPLLAALREDRAAAERSPGELVGLEFEPFTANQDPCEAYSVGEASKAAGRIRVPIFSVCSGHRLDAPSVTVEVEMREARWVITNVIYPDGDDLLALLQRQADNRRRP
jgi:hypothetical protein